MANTEKTHNSEINIAKFSNQRNCFLNFLKGVGCILVVFIHLPFPGEFGRIVSKVAQFVVPLFFMISGFYALSDNSCKLENLYRKARKIGVITFGSTLFYFLFYSVFHLCNHTFTDYAYNLISIRNFGRVVLLQNLTSISADHLWFLPSLFLCYLFLIIIEKNNKSDFSCILITLLLIIHLITSVSTDSKVLNWHYKSNFLCMGLFCF